MKQRAGSHWQSGRDEQARHGSERASLRAEGVVVGYGRTQPVLNGLDLDVLDAELTIIVGPNACGKSTLLRTLARVLPTTGGAVLLDGRPITSMGPKAVARRLGLLPQSPIAPDDVRVCDLVARGRYPHQGAMRQWSARDEQAVSSAMRAAGVVDLSQRLVRELSGGQRQRVWIAMALAQETDLLLLDEPTTYLDLAHQLEVLDLAARLHEDSRTVVAVLHDLNLAFRYATHLVVMRDGAVVTQGAPQRVVTSELIERVYGVACTIMEDPETGRPMVIPRPRGARRR